MDSLRGGGGEGRRVVAVTRKTQEQLERMREAGRVVAECHALVREMARPGVRTIDLDREVEALIRARGGTPAFLGYRGYPASICASVNDEVVHGIPNRRRLQEGDILSVDIGVAKDGWYGDAANTIPIGQVSAEAARLIEVCYEALARAIAAVRPGARLSEIARAVQSYVEGQGYAVVRKYVGHGIGSAMHEEPQVPNFVSPALLKNDLVLEPGMVLAIEPMVNQGTHQTRTKKNRWTVVTCDGKLSAHAEHTVAVTEQGHAILTLP
ncbi:MAG: methionine aminopeptidase [Planctomycetota bacterium]|nr:MAG: methionine aminopeptidase [Planctomycetota bacterium]